MRIEYAVHLPSRAGRRGLRDEVKQGRIPPGGGDWIPPRAADGVYLARTNRHLAPGEDGGWKGVRAGSSSVGGFRPAGIAMGVGPGRGLRRCARGGAPGLWRGGCGRGPDRGGGGGRPGRGPVRGRRRGRPAVQTRLREGGPRGPAARRRRHARLDVRAGRSRPGSGTRSSPRLTAGGICGPGEEGTARLLVGGPSAFRGRSSYRSHGAAVFETTTPGSSGLNRRTPR
jgi:hypothetical protein